MDASDFLILIQPWHSRYMFTYILITKVPAEKPSFNYPSSSTSTFPPPPPCALEYPSPAP